MTGAEVIADNSNTRGWLFDKNNRRTLDVFYTDYDTKLFVEDGTLIEENIKHSRTDDSSDEKTIKRFVEDGTLIEEKIKCSSTEVHSSDKESARLSEYYLCSSPPESPTAEESMDHSQTIETAKVALEYYNKKHHTQYELAEPVVSNGCVWRGGLWIHANFKAFDSSKKSHGDSSTKLFFAELKVCQKSGVPKDVVTACRPLNGAKRTTCCEMCGGGIFHPTGRFRQGLYTTKPRDLRPRQNGRVT